MAVTKERLLIRLNRPGEQVSYFTGQLNKAGGPWFVVNRLYARKYPSVQAAMAAEEEFGLDGDQFVEIVRAE